jgi:hypothetical protein
MAPAAQFEDIPYTILALAPFAPAPKNADAPPRRVRVDLSSLDQALEDFSPTLRIGVPRQFCPEAWVTVAPRSMRDFRPEKLLHVCPWLHDLEQARLLLHEARGAGRSPEAVARELREKWPQLPLNLDATPSGGGPAPSASGAVDDILAMVAAPETPKGGGLQGWSAQVESLMAGVLAAVYNDQGFRACEAAWQGARLLLKQAGVKEGAGVVLLLANVDTGDTSEAGGLARALDKLMPELAGELPNLALVDVFLDSAPQRIELARTLASFAETLLLPTIVGAGAEFFRLGSWQELGRIPYINHFLEDAGFAKWRNLRAENGAHWLAVALNGLLARPLYGQDNPPRTPMFSEAAPLWLNPVWGLGALAALSVVRHGWPSRLSDYHSVFLADQPVFRGAAGPMACETPLGEDRVAEFAEAGFVPLLGALHKDIALAPYVNALSGTALGPQLLLNRVLGFLFWCKENLTEEIEAGGEGEVAGNLQAAFSFFWRKSGHNPPVDLQIRAGEAEEGALPLTIRFTPPRDVLPGAAAMEFIFSW